MPGPSPDDLCAQITDSTATIAGLVSGTDLTRRVPTCPDWTLAELTTHVGRGQRWAAEIVATRSPEFIPFRQVPDGRLPDDRREHPDWLRAGASRLIAALGSAGTDLVWTHQGIAPATYWARRMAHETVVHRADAQIALGLPAVIDPVIAADGIDEWLGFLTSPQPGEADPRLAVLDGGRVLHLHATDEGLGADGEWLVHSTAGHVAVDHGHGRGGVAVRGPASSLLLLLVRRLAPGAAPLEVIGDRSLLDAWLAATPF